MNEKEIKQKIEDVLAIGQQTLETLHTAQIKLESAKSWLVLEGHGGSLLISMMKHRKTSDTQEYMELAKRDIVKFQIVLKSIVLPEEIRRRTGMYISFATFFLDGTIDEYMVKAKVGHAQEQIADAIRLVDEVCRDLKKWCILH